MYDKFPHVQLPNAPPAAPTIDACLGVGMVGGVKAFYAVLLALVLGVGCGESMEINHL